MPWFQFVFVHSQLRHFRAFRALPSTKKPLFAFWSSARKSPCSNNEWSCFTKPLRWALFGPSAVPKFVGKQVAMERATQAHPTWMIQTKPSAQFQMFQGRGTFGEDWCWTSCGTAGAGLVNRCLDAKDNLRVTCRVLQLGSKIRFNFFCLGLAPWKINGIPTCQRKRSKRCCGISMISRLLHCTLAILKFSTACSAWS